MSTENAGSWPDGSYIYDTLVSHSKKWNCCSNSYVHIKGGTMYVPCDPTLNSARYKAHHLACPHSLRCTLLVYPIARRPSPLLTTRFCFGHEFCTQEKRIWYNITTTCYIQNTIIMKESHICCKLPLLSIRQHSTPATTTTAASSSERQQ